MHVERELLIENAKTLSAALTHKKVRGKVDRVGPQAAKDFKSIDYQRGFMFAVATVLGCEGIPAFIGGGAAKQLSEHMEIVFSDFKLDKLCEREEAA